MQMPGGWRLEHSYSHLPKDFYEEVAPTKVSAPQLLIHHEPTLQELGLDRCFDAKQFAAIGAGNALPENAFPIAQAYAGHQFGGFTMLGDGRAILLGEQMTPDGKRLDVQLKGAGRTRYSRSGDGRAAVGPMLREFVISHAMQHLQIPTTRSLMVVRTGERVFRNNVLPGAVLTRIADSHLRVGTFQFAAATGKPENLRQLLDYAIWRHFPELGRSSREQGASRKSESRTLPEDLSGSEDVTGDVALDFLRKVVDRQAHLIAQWLAVGFVHGVMNTDNMTISGETIDYGPCAFMDRYDLATVFSSIDEQGRYAYANQPTIARWNLARLAETLLPLIAPEIEDAIEKATEVVQGFDESFNKAYLGLMQKKIGLESVPNTGESELNDSMPIDLAILSKSLIERLLQIMQQTQSDWTNTFRKLSSVDSENAIENSPEFTDWHFEWQIALDKSPSSSEEIRQRMQRVNPAIIPRNEAVEAALHAAESEEDLTQVKLLVEKLADPFRDFDETDPLCQVPSVGQTCYKTFCGT